MLKDFRKKRRVYKRLIREKEKNSWEKYVYDQMKDNTWGVPYKIAVGKIKPLDIFSAIGEGTLTWEDSATKLLDELVLDDSCDGELGFHDTVRHAVWRDQGGWERCILKEKDVDNAVRMAKRGKAPGIDGIKVEFIQEGWDLIRGPLLKVLNGCLKFHVFPNRWKGGEIRALLKGEDKNPSLGRSYRPICLLSVLGKLFERVLVDKLDRIFYAGINEAQFGYMRGRSTEDAIITFRRLVETSESKYITGMFVDMTGAFDRVWWPGILHKLRIGGVSGDLFGVLKDYLRGRFVSISSGTWEVGKRVNRGCPQGSVLGPQIWKLIMDGLLRKIGNKFGVVAYADDIVILIEGNSRNELEIRGRDAAGLLEEWCMEEKMLLSKDKSVGVLLKGFLDKGRMPIIELGGNRLKFVDSVSYLGVVWSKGMKIKDHVAKVTKKAYNKLMGVIRILGNKGVSYNRIMGIYKGMYLPMITYAAGAWGDKLNLGDRKKLLSEQRIVGLRMIKGYRTLSGEAVRVIGGLVPLDLEVEKRWVSKWVKLKGEISWEGNIYKRIGLKGKIQKGVIEIWQKRWETSTSGRWTFRWWENVKGRLEAGWIQPAYHVTQILGGHGDFKGKLRELGLVRSGNCKCRIRETVEHVLFDCKRWEGERVSFSIGRDRMQALVSEQGFQDLKDFAEAVLGRKERDE